MCRRMKVRGRSWITPSWRCGDGHWRSCQAGWRAARPHRGLAERMGGTHQTPAVAPPGSGASLCHAGGICLDLPIVPCLRDSVQRALGHAEAPTMPCSCWWCQLPARCSWSAPAPSHQDLTFASSYFAGTAHVTVMGMKCVPLPQLNGPFHPMATNHPHATSIR